jgi:tetratricopeptide (TPR) repeat protein
VHPVELDKLLEFDGSACHLQPPVIVHPGHGQAELLRHLFELPVEGFLDEVVRRGVVEPDGRDEDDLGFRGIPDSGDHLLDVAPEELRGKAAEGIVEGKLQEHTVRVVEIHIGIDQAETTLRQGLRIRGDHPDLLNNLAWVLMEKGRLEEAKSLIDKAIAIEDKEEYQDTRQEILNRMNEK